VADSEPPRTDRIPQSWERLSYDDAITLLVSHDADERYDAALALAHHGSSAAVGPLRDARLCEDVPACRAAMGSAIALLCGEYPDSESEWWPNDPHPEDFGIAG
jgi:hypothetical protein